MGTKESLGSVQKRRRGQEVQTVVSSFMGGQRQRAAAEGSCRSEEELLFKAGGVLAHLYAERKKSEEEGNLRV